MSDMCFLRILGFLPFEVQDLLLKPKRVFMLLMVCKQLRSIIRREGVGDNLKFQVTVRPKDMYPRGAGVVHRLRTLDYLCVTELQLQRTSMRGCFGEIRSILTALPRLRSLDVSDNNLYNTDIWEIAHEMLHLNTSLTKFSIGGNSEGAGMSDFIQQMCTSLKDLDVSRMSLDTQTIRRMAKVLPIASLKKLNLNGNSMNSRNTHRIVGGLARNTSLTSLDLGNNLFCDLTANHMAGMLAQNTSITALGIARMQARHACTVLNGITSANTTLTHLDISEIRFAGSISEDFITAMLRGNTPIRVLDLSNCKMLPWTVVTVAEAVSQHSTLTSLRLVGNSMVSRYTTPVLCNLARTCTRLVELHIGT
jgi:hypothetical protein